MNKKEIMDVFDWFFEDTGNLNYDADYLADKYIDSRKQVKNIAYEPVLEVVNCAVCGKELTEQEKEGGNCCDECWLRN